MRRNPDYPTCDALIPVRVCSSQTTLSHCRSAGGPPVEYTHRHCGGARCPRCWCVCALQSRSPAQCFTPGGPLSANIFTPVSRNKLRWSEAAFQCKEKWVYLRVLLPVPYTNHFSATTTWCGYMRPIRGWHTFFDVSAALFPLLQ